MAKKKTKKVKLRGFIQRTAFTKNGKIFIEPMYITKLGDTHYLVDRRVEQDGVAYQSHMQAVPLSQYNAIMKASGHTDAVLTDKDAILNAYHVQMDKLLNGDTSSNAIKPTFYFANSGILHNDKNEVIGISSTANYEPVPAKLRIVDSDANSDDAETQDVEAENDIDNNDEDEFDDDDTENQEVQSRLAKLMGYADANQVAHLLPSEDNTTGYTEDDAVDDNTEYVDSSNDEPAIDDANVGVNETSDDVNTDDNAQANIDNSAQKVINHPDTAPGSQLISHRNQKLGQLSTEDFNAFLARQMGNH